MRSTRRKRTDRRATAVSSVATASAPAHYSIADRARDSCISKGAHRLLQSQISVTHNQRWQHLGRSACWWSVLDEISFFSSILKLKVKSHNIAGQETRHSHSQKRGNFPFTMPGKTGQGKSTREYSKKFSKFFYSYYIQVHSLSSL